MNEHGNFLNETDIPTVRRLDYIVKDTDPMESGYLYVALRKLTALGYNDKEKTDNAYFKRAYPLMKSKLIPQMEWVNQWMTAHGKEVIFTNMDDPDTITKDYDYYWGLRTQEQFVEEEAAARAGENGRTPVKE